MRQYNLIIPSKPAVSAHSPLSTGDMAKGAFALYEICSKYLSSLEEIEGNIAFETKGNSSYELSESLCMLGCIAIELTLKEIIRLKQGRVEETHSISDLFKMVRSSHKTFDIFDDLNKFFLHNKHLNSRFKNKTSFTKLSKKGLRSFHPDYRHRGEQSTPDASLVIIILKFMEMRGYLDYPEVPRSFDKRYVDLGKIKDYK